MRWQFVGHRQEHHALVRLCQQTGVRDDAALRQGERQINTAQQTLVVDVVWHALQVQPQMLQLLQPSLSRGAITRVKPDAAQAHRVHLQTQERALRLFPGVLHQASTSSKLRCTRSPEPVSSKGLRRKRWRRASGAIARKCAEVTFFAPCKAA